MFINLGEPSFHGCQSLESVTFERVCIERLGESVFDGTRFDVNSVVVNSRRRKWGLDCDSSPQTGSSPPAVCRQKEIPESIRTLKDVAMFVRVVNDRRAPFGDVNSTAEQIEKVVQSIVGCEDLGDVLFAILDRMRSSLCNMYPEIQSFIRGEMARLKQGRDCYSSDHYVELGRQIWNGIYD
jgi:hypothetical protein